MMRKSLLWLSEQQQVFNFLRTNPLARKFASRFVAGETIESAVAAVREINQKGITASLDLLGESVTREEDAAAARDTYLQMLDQIATTKVDSNVSVKLTQMGLDIREEACFANMSAILEKARALNTFVRLDMEGSAYTQRTLDFFTNRLFSSFGSVTGVVIQAFPEKADVDRNYVTLMERLLEHGNYPGLATHDEQIIAHAKEFARARRIPAGQFEFQMLYGVRRDLQEALRREGWNMRVYIPFGTQWYPYLMRRLAERPANIAFMLGNVVKEALPGQ
jgi:proline dehydrogenase